MFCPECGSKNADDAVFCENCGINITVALQEALQKFQQNTPPTGANVSSPNKARKPLKTSAKVTLGIVAAVIVAGIVLFQVGKSQSSPEKAAMDYFGALQAQDWNAAYRKLDIGGSELLTEKSFEAVQKQKAKDEEIVSYELSPDPSFADLSNRMGPSPKNTGSQWKNVEIEYLTKGSSSPQTQDFTLVKQPEKKWFFFDTWKISTNNAYSLVTPEVTILAPADVTVSLSDIKLGSKYLVKGKNSDSNNPYALVTYSVKKIFSGHYTIRATSPDTEDYIRPMDFDGSIGSLVISRKDLKLKKTILNAVAKLPGDMIRALYSAALAGRDFNSVSSCFVADPDSLDSLRDKYNDIKNLISKGSRGGFKSIDFTSFHAEADPSSSDTENIVVNTNVKYSFTTVPGSFADITPTPYTGSNSSMFRMKLRNVKGKWLVADMSDVCLSWRNGSSAN